MWSAYRQLIIRSDDSVTIHSNLKKARVSLTNSENCTHNFLTEALCRTTAKMSNYDANEFNFFCSLHKPHEIQCLENSMKPHPKVVWHSQLLKESLAAFLLMHSLYSNNSNPCSNLVQTDYQMQLLAKWQRRPKDRVWKAVWTKPHIRLTWCLYPERVLFVSLKRSFQNPLHNTHTAVKLTQGKTHEHTQLMVSGQLSLNEQECPLDTDRQNLAYGY